jgi:death-on-curing protein
MDPPIFLSVADVLSLHADTMSEEGGLGGLRDAALLESAVMMPQQQFGGSFLHPHLHEMATAYLFHLANNHPFADGNKRVAAMAAFVFLDLNGYDLVARPKDFEKTVFGVAAGQLTKSDLTSKLESNIRERS